MCLVNGISQIVWLLVWFCLLGGITIGISHTIKSERMSNETGEIDAERIRAIESKKIIEKGHPIWSVGDCVLSESKVAMQMSIEKRDREK